MQPNGNIAIKTENDVHSLVIENCDVDDVAKYTCVAKNKCGEVSESAELTITRKFLRLLLAAIKRFRCCLASEISNRRIWNQLSRKKLLQACSGHGIPERNEHSIPDWN